MINWMIGLFVAVLLAAFLGFGAEASAFSAIAQIIFFVLLVLFVVSAAVAFFGARTPGVHSAVLSVSLVVLVAAFGVGAYAWIETGMSVERLARPIDHEAVSLADTLGQARFRSEARTVDDIRRDTAADDPSASNTQNASRA